MKEKYPHAIITERKMGVISILPKGDKPRQFIKKIGDLFPFLIYHIKYYQAVLQTG